MSEENHDKSNYWVPNLYFQHADGNRWYLAKPVSGKAQGWTTWQKHRYPLACWQ